MCLCTLAAIATLQAAPAVEIGGTLKCWHKATLTFVGPDTSEDATPNPFRDYRLNVVFTHARSGKRHVVPGYYAADGRAAETSATAGNRWRVDFTPDEQGEWRYTASFRSGRDVAVSLDAQAGSPAAFDGASGGFSVGPSDKRGSDLRGKGLLQYVGGHYLQFAGNGEFFLKGGADSPENFLAYADFDGTWDADAGSGSYKEVGAFIHRYAPHVQDWRSGDPTWKGGKGKGIIGALNYLSSKGVNSVYFLTYNLDGGDGRDTWPWTDPTVRDRFDVSKLDQWEIVFNHMDRMGIMLHVVTQETENDRALGGGAGLNLVRMLYLRELAARFGHHPALVWNLGEENNTPDKDRKEIARYIRAHDPYRHPITVHTHANRELSFYDGILGDPFFECTSIQAFPKSYHHAAIALRKRSAEAGRKWVIFGDEQNPATRGVLPDAADPTHDEARVEALWGNLIGGGGGVEWYFGSKFPNMDINCEDFRSRERMWDQTRNALAFFDRHLPFAEMEPDDSLVAGVPDGRVLHRGEEVFAVQLPSGGDASLKLGAGTYSIRWYDPRAGGELQTGTVATVRGPGVKAIGAPPAEPGKDWVALVQKR